MTEETKPQGETPEKPAETVEPKAEKPIEPEKQEKPAPDEWEPERAMSTIKTLREQEKQWKKDQKELETLRADKQARDEAEMTELEKAQKRIAEFEAQNAEMQATIWRNQAATEANLPSIFAERVKGKTLEEMQKDALALAEALPKSTNKNPSLKATNPPNGEQKKNDAELREQFFGHQGNYFDSVDNIKKQGGGVFMNSEPE